MGAAHVLGSVTEMIPIIAIGGGLLIGLVSVIAGTILKIMTTRSKEATRREIAAYVAEGSMRPEDAEKILEAGMPGWERLGKR